jgi:hypothetical protein
MSRIPMVMSRIPMVQGRSPARLVSVGRSIAGAVLLAVLLAACTSSPEGPNLLAPDQADMVPVEDVVDEGVPGGPRSRAVVGWVTQGNASLVAATVDGNPAARIVASADDPVYTDRTRTVRVGTTPVAIVAGHTYLGTVGVKAVGSGAPVRCEIRWYDGDGAIIDTVPGAESVDGSQEWTDVQCEATAPANAVTGSLRVHIADADYGDEHLIDGASLVALNDESRAEISTPPSTSEQSTSVPVGGHDGHGGDVGHGPAPESPAGGCGSGEGVACESSNMSGSVFIERFNGNPDAPTSLVNALPRWFATPVMQAAHGGWGDPEPMLAQHTQGCGAPPGTHQITKVEQSIFSCKDHLMTAINPPSGGTSGSVVPLKPNHMADLSGGEAVIRIDVSTLSPSKGDWWEIWITNWDDTLVAPADHWFHQAGPAKGLMLQVVDLDATKHWTHKFFGQDYKFSGGIFDFWKAPNIRPLVSESDTRRDTYEIRLSKTSGELWIEESATGDMVKVDDFVVPSGTFDDHVVVQFQQSNYEPDLDGKFGANPKRVSPATWHWDNAEISPAVPYYIGQVTPLHVGYATESKTIDLAEPAPAGAELMFVALSWGNAPKVDFGSGPVTASAVRPPNDPPIAGFGGDPDLLTYKVPVPEGATSGVVSGNGGCPTCSLGWSAYGFHIISKET